MTALLLLQHSDDLLVRKPCTLHSARLLDTTDSTKIWRKFRGSGHKPSGNSVTKSRKSSIEPQAVICWDQTPRVPRVVRLREATLGTSLGRYKGRAAVAHEGVIGATGPAAMPPAMKDLSLALAGPSPQCYRWTEIHQDVEDESQRLRDGLQCCHRVLLVLNRLYCETHFVGNNCHLVRTCTRPISPVGRVAW
jgi:hypothetical protein